MSESPKAPTTSPISTTQSSSTAPLADRVDNGARITDSRDADEQASAEATAARQHGASERHDQYAHREGESSARSGHERGDSAAGGRTFEEDDTTSDDDDDEEHDDEAYEGETDEDDDEPRDPLRAGFLDDLPEHEALQPLVAAFAQGNYARLRQLEQALASQTDNAEVLAAARELVQRTAPDPLARKLLLLSVLFFLFIVGWVYLHHGH